jgi:ABC-2 type transport system permease protein
VAEAQIPGRLHPYRAILGSRIRSQLQYRTSFAFDLVNSIGFGLLEYLEVYLIFHNVPTLGGLDWGQSLVVFALARTSFALADLVVGHIDGIPTYVRTGTLDVLLLRPLPVLLQLVLSDISLRRLGRLALYLVVFALALHRVSIDWTPARLALVPATVLGGCVIFSAVFIVAGASQFRLLDGGEFANAFTYGGGYVASYSAEVLPAPVRAFFTAVVPATFTGYLPALALLGEPGPPGFPAWLGWCTLPVAALALTVALRLWRSGIRHYQGGGG